MYDVWTSPVTQFLKQIFTQNSHTQKISSLQSVKLGLCLHFTEAILHIYFYIINFSLFFIYQGLHTDKSIFLSHRCLPAKLALMKLFFCLFVFLVKRCNRIIFRRSFIIFLIIKKKIWTTYLSICNECNNLLAFEQHFLSPNRFTNAIVNLPPQQILSSLFQRQRNRQRGPQCKSVRVLTLEINLCVDSSAFCLSSICRNQPECQLLECTAEV